MHAQLIRDTWLAERLGCNVYQVPCEMLLDVCVDGKDFDYQDLMPELQEPPVFAYVKIPVDKSHVVNELLQIGFKLVDTNLQFEKILTSTPAINTGSTIIRLAEPNDEQQIADLAKRSFCHSRFHADLAISDLQANEIKADWSRSFFHGERGDAMVVAVNGDRVVGFLLSLQTTDKVLVIDLITVDESMRSQGLAGAMTWFTQAQFPNAGKLRVGTQLANIAAIRCYERLGFELVRSHYVLHYHNS